jgi:hypothetical protein
VGKLTESESSQGGRQSRRCLPLRQIDGRLRDQRLFSEEPVFVSRDDPDVYLVVEDNYAWFTVNFRTQHVYAYGSGLFLPPSRSFGVLIFDRKQWPPGGIPIESARGNQATFEGRSVSWH